LGQYEARYSIASVSQVHYSVVLLGTGN